MNLQSAVFIHLCLPHILEVSTGVGHIQGVGLDQVVAGREDRNPGARLGFC